MNKMKDDDVRWMAKHGFDWLYIGVQKHCSEWSEIRGSTYVVWEVVSKSSCAGVGGVGNEYT